MIGIKHKPHPLQPLEETRSLPRASTTLGGKKGSRLRAIIEEQESPMSKLGIGPKPQDIIKKISIVSLLPTVQRKKEQGLVTQLSTSCLTPTMGQLLPSPEAPQTQTKVVLTETNLLLLRPNPTHKLTGQPALFRAKGNFTTSWIHDLEPPPETLAAIAELQKASDEPAARKATKKAKNIIVDTVEDPQEDAQERNLRRTKSVLEALKLLVDPLVSFCHRRTWSTYKTT
jgi:hypothetical protein